MPVTSDVASPSPATARLDSRPKAYWPVEREPGLVPGACTHTIPASVDRVEGEGNYAQVNPGDTLCLPAGTRGNIQFLDLHGTSDSPITIRNSGGVVVITGATSKRGGIGVVRSSWIHISGAGISARCGARYEPREQECGIEIEHAYNGIRIQTDGDVHNFEIDHTFVHTTATSPEVHSTGISIQPQRGQTIAGFDVHDNHVADIYREGLYIGSEPRDPYPTLGKLTNVDVSWNLVERTGYDGIKLKVVIADLRVHDNVVRDTALTRYLHHETGISLDMSAGYVYNNLVERAVEGIDSGRPLPNPGSRYFNNVVVATAEEGIWVDEDRALIFNNTVVESGGTGIKAKGTGAQIFDNVVAGSGDVSIVPQAESDVANLTGSVASVGFVDPLGGDYHLTARSLGRDSGRPRTYPAFDRDRVSRPQGAWTDRGAYESPGRQAVVHCRASEAESCRQ